MRFQVKLKSQKKRNYFPHKTQILIILYFLYQSKVFHTGHNEIRDNRHSGAAKGFFLEKRKTLDQ